MTTSTDYVLIDYENIQPENLNALKHGWFKIKIFLGSQQNKLPVAFITSLQAIDSQFELIQLKKSGNNALDFHIAYFIGDLVHHDAKAGFYIVSKDTGYDALIQTLTAQKIKIQRVDNIQKINNTGMPRSDTKKTPQDRAVALLKKYKNAPTSKKALIHVLKTGDNRHLSDTQIESLHERLCQDGFVVYEGNKPVLQRSRFI